MKTLLLLSLLLVTNTYADSEERAREIVAKMTIDEKIDLVHGVQGPYVGVSKGNDRFNVPQLNEQDGPQGVGDGLQNVTFWPCTLAAVSTWDEELMYKYSEAIGWEQRKKGVNVHLGPMVNIARVPQGGRNFESFGEDPHLSSAMVAQYVRGIQSNKVVATVKHFVANNQETNRSSSSANVGIRAMWEIYYPAFHSAVKAGVGAVMCSYNRINGTYACENNETLSRDLKGKMGYKGFVMSDWGGTHSTEEASNHGLDQEMPDDSYFGSKLKNAVIAGRVPQSRLDDMAVRILTSLYNVGIMDTPQTGNVSDCARNSSHDTLSRTIAAAATVLLKNEDDILPIHKGIRKIAVIGDDGNKSTTAGGGGSGSVVAPYVITPLEGIKKRAGLNIEVIYVDGSDTKAAANAASEADIAIVFVSAFSSEGSDRSLNLRSGHDELVEAVAASQEDTIVYALLPGAVLMPWEGKVKGIVSTFFPGQEAGNAIAEVLWGDVNPSGKLPLTFPANSRQFPANTVQQWPGIDNEAEYSEGIFVGYRWYDQGKHKPLYPFGHGLSYTHFKIGKATAKPKGRDVQIDFPIANTGDVAGAEVVQLYLTFPASAQEPPKVLRGFKKVTLTPGQLTKMTMVLKAEDFRVWSVEKDDWEDIKGRFVAHVGTSSRDIRTSAVIPRS